MFLFVYNCIFAFAGHTKPFLFLCVCNLIFLAQQWLKKCFYGLYLVFRDIKNSTVFRLCQGSGENGLGMHCTTCTISQLIILCCIMLGSHLKPNTISVFKMFFKLTSMVCCEIESIFYNNCRCEYVFVIIITLNDFEPISGVVKTFPVWLNCKVFLFCFVLFYRWVKEWMRLRKLKLLKTVGQRLWNWQDLWNITEKVRTGAISRRIQ